MFITTKYFFEELLDPFIEIFFNGNYEPFSELDAVWDFNGAIFVYKNLAIGKKWLYKNTYIIDLDKCL